MPPSEKAAPYISLCFFVFALLAIGLVVCHLLGTGGLRHLELENIEVLAIGSPGVGSISEIWFSPEHALLAAQERDASPTQLAALTLNRWNPRQLARGKTTTSITLTGHDGMFPRDAFGLSNPLRSGPGQQGRLPRAHYAVSDDGSRFACAWNGMLYVVPAANSKFDFNSKSAQRAPLSSQVEVDALSFDDDGGLAVIQSGIASFWSTRKTLERLNPRGGDYPLDGPGAWLIWSRRGPFRLFSNFDLDSPSLWRFNYGVRPHGGGLKPNLLRYVLSRDGKSMAVSPQGKVLIGSGEGFILWSRQGGLSPAGAFEGPINCLAFYDETSAVACSGGSGLALFDGLNASSEEPFPGPSKTRRKVDKNNIQKIRRLIPAPKDIRLLAIDRPYGAFATANSLSLARLEWKWELDDRDKTWVSLMFSIVGLLAFMRLAALDGYKVLENHRAAAAAKANGNSSDPATSPRSDPAAGAPSDPAMVPPPDQAASALPTLPASGGGTQAPPGPQRPA